ncbi:MAG: NAD+ synthase [Candidatus Thermoplasmatota archaeon]|nr:NAD+ synthase [Candidatus Thermoplasmatota archaeon]MBU1940404.1 NAD+ synthase [Candidatus Thermoplasmatota archaeon]
MGYQLSINPEEVTTIITEFIRTYVSNANAEGVVIGLSGGIDSAVVSILCKKALGPERVLCLFMPDETTPKIDTEHQKIIIEKFGLKNLEIDISPIVKKINNTFPEEPDKKLIANIKARIRMILLYHYANLLHGIVCGASNKSEMLTGYFTKYGDGGVDLQPIADIYKTQVYQLARYLNIPKPLHIKPPSAGLWQGQTDEIELGMTYKILDQILYGLELKYSTQQIAQELRISEYEVDRIHTIRVKSQHKRRLPLIPKIGVRTPGLDWRVPIQEG